MIRIFILSALLLLGPTPFIASEASQPPTASEVLMLPRYCWGDYNPAMKDNSKVFENCGGHMNHYCGSVLEFNRANLIQDKYKRYQKLVVALRGVEYGLNGMKNAPACAVREDVLQMYSRVRIAFASVGKPVPPDRFSGQLAKPARTYSPGHLDTNPEEKPREETKTATDLKQDSVAMPDKQGANSSSANEDGNSTGSVNSSKNEQTQEPQTIGSPTNPYCRFCPD